MPALKYKVELNESERTEIATWRDAASERWCC